jgi:hypothetical protein
METKMSREKLNLPAKQKDIIVLVLEDIKMLRDTICGVLERKFGIPKENIFRAESVDSAKKNYKEILELGKSVGLILADQNMGEKFAETGGNGEDFLKWVRTEGRYEGIVLGISSSERDFQGNNVMKSANGNVYPYVYIGKHPSEMFTNMSNNLNISAVATQAATITNIHRQPTSPRSSDDQGKLNVEERKSL